jgi:hypothetical protein
MSHEQLRPCVHRFARHLIVLLRVHSFSAA